MYLGFWCNEARAAKVARISLIGVPRIVCNFCPYLEGNEVPNFEVGPIDMLGRWLRAE
jgi:hypothetical protein